MGRTLTAKCTKSNFVRSSWRIGLFEHDVKGPTPRKHSGLKSDRYAIRITNVLAAFVMTTARQGRARSTNTHSYSCNLSRRRFSVGGSVESAVKFESFCFRTPASFPPPDHIRANHIDPCAFASYRARPTASPALSIPEKTRRSFSLPVETRSSGK